MDLPEELAALAAQQLGLLTRAQLRAGGVTSSALRWRLGRGWSLALPSVVAINAHTLTAAQRLTAALLEAGEDAVVTGHHACWWHGLTNTRVDRPVEVLVPMRHSSRATGFLVVRRTRRPDAHPLRRPPMRIASRPRAVIDAARSAVSDDEGLALVLEATQRRLVTLAQLEHEVEASAIRGSARARRLVKSARVGAWSVPEDQLLRLCASSKVLPHAYPNPELESATGDRLISPDVWFDDIALAAMVHSRSFHLRDEDWEGTVERDGELTAHGVIVIGFTARTIRRDGLSALRRLERAYLSAAASGRRRPPVRMIPRSWGLVNS